MKPTKRKVSLSGHGVFWLLGNLDGTAPLAPLEHCGPRGGLLPQFPVPLSYAHVMEDGAIMRFGRVIGHRDELKPVRAAKRKR